MVCIMKLCYWWRIGGSERYEGLGKWMGRSAPWTKASGESCSRATFLTPACHSPGNEIWKRGNKIMKSLTEQTWCNAGKPASVELTGRCPMRDVRQTPGGCEWGSSGICQYSTTSGVGNISDRGLVKVTLQRAKVPVWAGWGWWELWRCSNFCSFGSILPQRPKHLVILSFLH